MQGATTFTEIFKIIKPSSPNHSKNPLIRAVLELAVEDMGTIYNTYCSLM